MRVVSKVFVLVFRILFEMGWKTRYLHLCKSQYLTKALQPGTCPNPQQEPTFTGRWSPSPRVLPVVDTSDTVCGVTVPLNMSTTQAKDTVSKQRITRKALFSSSEIILQDINLILTSSSNSWLNTAEIVWIKHNVIITCGHPHSA